MKNTTQKIATRILALALLAVPTLTTVACNSSEVPATPATPFRVHAIFDESADAAAQVRDALAQAAQQHKRVLLDFGGNWCGDCQILDYYFHQPPNSTLIDQNYILVDLDVGHLDRNVALANQYGVTLRHGVPALAILDAQGHVLYSQNDGEFSSMGRVDPAAVTRLLQQWKVNS
ncbi:MAG TPA: thioredoxin family protein [Acidobacteriaceae bacterium]|nr:thioredoxin family protein [Acidobacteriaceae bacterium]